MKNSNITYLLIGLLSFALISCNEDDFLQEDPVTNLSTQTFFESEQDFRQATNAVYTNLQTMAGGTNVGTGTGGFWAMSELRSDNSTYQYNTVDLSGHFTWYLDNFIMATTNPVVNVFWNAAYEGIGKANIVIQQSEDKEYDNKEQIVAEAKFLRALYYSYLLRYFGNIPLVTEPTASYEEAFANNAQVDKQQVYELILADLNEAKTALPANYSAQDQGKATSGAARTLLAKELMELERYSEAASELEAVINSGEYMLLEDYSDVFDVENENNQELIFSVQFIEGVYGLSSMYMYLFAPWNAGPELLGHAQQIARTGMNIPTTDLIESFEKGDDRKSMIDLSYIDEVNGFYQGNIVPFNKKFWDSEHSIQYQTGTNFPLFRYPHVLLMLAECYLRAGGGDPVALVNQVRTRAGLPTVASVTLEDIIHERRVEFYGEADRWDVLVRTNKVFEVMEAHGENERQNRSEVHVGDAAFRDIKVLYPIPASAIQTDPSLQQNPEYL
ncbi:RagB/SusD family nutrient uptake outer membrane protein [Catalinimonas niigatensis]|uniref:RagB/SusD family nutrient uptake outer membrane protein n=1 Tax=Catalinimonas niigatensis TaxID=1397264 RepID=UPI002666FE10|nr:RagB/SusD family nutrient uptake outer membrane protein [Catalinimonas niigatensis]WPP51985.1 RagB/SusD family nutrient uptake outer membrane protein [Catalinimonas niigatensis]